MALSLVACGEKKDDDANKDNDAATGNRIAILVPNAKNNDRKVRHLGSKRFGIQFLIKGIYTYNGMLYAVSYTHLLRAKKKNDTDRVLALYGSADERYW